MVSIFIMASANLPPDGVLFASGVGPSGHAPLLTLRTVVCVSMLRAFPR